MSAWSAQLRTAKADKPFELHYPARADGRGVRDRRGPGEGPQGPGTTQRTMPRRSATRGWSARWRSRCTRSRRRFRRTGARPSSAPRCARPATRPAFAKWQSTKHSHAFDALVNQAKKPSNRQFDPECVVCHTIGYGYQSGYLGDQKTAHLKHVGCENCHGPGSAPRRRAAEQSTVLLTDPWKSQPGELLPDLETLRKGHDALARLERTCCCVSTTSARSATTPTTTRTTSSRSSGPTSCTASNPARAVRGAVGKGEPPATAAGGSTLGEELMPEPTRNAGPGRLAKIPAAGQSSPCAFV